MMIAYPNRAGGGAYSGGAWLPALPVSHLQSPELWRVARSVDLDPASTQFRVDLGSAYPLRAFALCNHNLGKDDTWRLMLGTTPGAADVYDSGHRPAWTMSWDGLVDWESAVWWSGIAGDDYLRSPYASMRVLSDYLTARHITIEIRSPDNPDGYVQLGRVFAGSALSTAYGTAMGLQDGWRDLSTTDQSAESGALFAVKRRRLRTTSFVIPYISHIKAAYFHDLQRMVGTTDEVLYIPSESNMDRSQRYGYLARLAELSPIDYPYFTGRSLPLKLEEIA